MWQRDLGPYKGLHGSSNSPIIAEGLVVLANDQMIRSDSLGISQGTNMDPSAPDRTRP